MPDGLEVKPDDELTFVLTPSEATPKATLTLKHPAGGSHSEPVAFKVCRSAIIHVVHMSVHMEEAIVCVG